MDAINGLIGRSRLNVLTKPDGEPLFKIVSEELAKEMEKLSYEQQLVYQIIADSGS